MKKLIPLALVLALATCNLASPGSPGASKPGVSKPPMHVAISGARGLFLQTGTASKGMKVHARDVASGAQLMKINPDLSIGPATFTAADGSTVDVTITAIRQVSATYFLIAYIYSGGSTTAAVDASGNMAVLANPPTYLQQVRILGSIAYFTSGSMLYSADFENGAETAIGSGLAGNEYLHVTPEGDVYAWGAVPYSGYSYGECWIFLAAGGTPVTFPNIYGIPVYGSSGGGSVVEDQNTGDMWYVIWGVPNIQVGKFVFNGVTGDPGTYVTIGTETVAGGNVRLGQQAYFQGALFVGTTTTASLATDGADGLIVTQWNTSGFPTPGGSGEGTILTWQYDGTYLYTAPWSGANNIQQVTLPGGGGTVSAAALVSDASTISSFAIVGGQVLFTDATGTYQQATTVGASATLYSSTPVNVTPVGQ